MILHTKQARRSCVQIKYVLTMILEQIHSTYFGINAIGSGIYHVLKSGYSVVIAPLLTKFC